MKKMMIFLAAAALIGSISLMAQNGKGPGYGAQSGQCSFIDENGDGINDNFRDHDGDGIPNHLDPDWTRPQDGSGYKGQYRNGSSLNARRGGGAGSFSEMRRLGQGNGSAAGSGVCDGTAQRLGSGRRGGRG